MIQTDPAPGSTATDELFQVWIKCNISAQHINDSLVGSVDTCLEKNIVGGWRGEEVVEVVERGCNLSQRSSSADTLYLTCGERELILLMRGLKIGCC